VGAEPFYQAHKSEAALALHQREQAAAVLLADERVSFLITKARPLRRLPGGR
jgi:hypothetical protein